MTNKNITEPIIKGRKTYTARFDRYSVSKDLQVLINFTDVADDKDNLIKTYFSIEAESAPNIVGNLMYEQKVLFSARIAMHTSLLDGFNLINVSFYEDNELIGYRH